jgi:hypothetical protein
MKTRVTGEMTVSAIKALESIFVKVISWKDVKTPREIINFPICGDYHTG